MAKPPGKLTTLLRLLEHREALAGRRLADRVQAVASARGRADDMSEMRDEYHLRLTRAGGAGFTGAELRLWRRFTDSLGEVVAVQSAELDGLQHKLAAAQQDCAAARARRKGGELLQQARQRQEALVERRKERVSSSDAAARRRR